MAKRKKYWDWCETHCPSDEDGRIVEPSRANPTQFPEREPGPDSDELRAIKEFLADGGLDKLPVRQRRAFKLVFIEGLTFRAAGVRMGITATAVHKRVQAAGKHIRHLLEDKV